VVVGDAVAAPALAPSPAPTPAPTPAKRPLDVPPPAGTEPPTLPPEPPASIPPATRPGGGTTAIPETSGLITIWVPYEAKVTVNGNPTKSTGSRRQFVSFGLKPGYSYKYEIRAELVRDGQTVSESKTVVLTAGQREGVAFGFNKATAELASTR